jgi:hypothetical protein
MQKNEGWLVGSYPAKPNILGNASDGNMLHRRDAAGYDAPVCIGKRTSMGTTGRGQQQSHSQDEYQVTQHRPPSLKYGMIERISRHGADAQRSGSVADRPLHPVPLTTKMLAMFEPIAFRLQKSL